MGGPCGTVAEGGDEAAWVDVEKALGLLVGVYFYVLVGDLLVLERDPYTLHEGTGEKLICWSGITCCSYVGIIEEYGTEHTRMRYHIALGHCPLSGFSPLSKRCQ